MSDLSKKERAVLRQQQQDFPTFVADAASATEALVREVMPADADSYLSNLGHFIRRFDDVARDQHFDEASGKRMFLTITRLVGEYLRQAYGGRWAINEDPEERTFGHYLVEIPIGESGTYPISPADLAQAFVASPPPRSLNSALQPLRDLLSDLRGEG